MKYIPRSLRLTPSQDTLARRLAASHQRSVYAILGESVRLGLAALSGEASSTQAISELAREMGAIGAELAHVERVLERCLFVGVSGYSYARIAAAGRVDEAKLAREISEAFERQLRLAGGE